MSKAGGRTRRINGGGPFNAVSRFTPWYSYNGKPRTKNETPKPKNGEVKIIKPADPRLLANIKKEV